MKKISTTMVSFLFLCASLLPLAIPATAFAAGSKGIDLCAKIDEAKYKRGFEDPLGEKQPNFCIFDLINRVITGLLFIAGTGFFAMFLWGGFTWLTSAGESKKIENAQTTFKNAVIGIAIVSLSYILVTNLLNLFAPKLAG